MGIPDVPTLSNKILCYFFRFHRRVYTQAYPTRVRILGSPRTAPIFRAASNGSSLLTRHLVCVPYGVFGLQLFHPCATCTFLACLIGTTIGTCSYLYVFLTYLGLGLGIIVQRDHVFSAGPIYREGTFSGHWTLDNYTCFLWQLRWNQDIFSSRIIWNNFHYYNFKFIVKYKYCLSFGLYIWGLL